MALLFSSVVRRHMKGTSGFAAAAENAALPASVTLDGDEALVGSYRNPAPWEETSLVFTSEAIWIVEGDKTERMALRDIVGYESPGTKSGVTGLRVRTRDGFRFIRIAGAYGPNGKYKDFIGFMMVLRAVVGSASVT